MRICSGRCSTAMSLFSTIEDERNMGMPRLKHRAFPRSACQVCNGSLHFPDARGGKQKIAEFGDIRGTLSAQLDDFPLVTAEIDVRSRSHRKERMALVIQQVIATIPLSIGGKLQSTLGGVEKVLPRRGHGPRGDKLAVGHTRSSPADGLNRARPDGMTRQHER